MLYVYALVDADGRGPRPTGTGHDGAGLCVVARGEVAAICSRHEHIDLPVDREHLWRHERVAEALMDDHAVLPVRFGTTVADDDALAAMLDGPSARVALTGRPPASRSCTAARGR